MEITKDTLIGEMLEKDMGIAYVLMQCGMHCVGCPASAGESIYFEASEQHLLKNAADGVSEVIYVVTNSYL